MEKVTEKGKGSIYKNGKKIGEAYYQITVIAAKGFIGFMGGQDNAEGAEDIYGYLTDINAKGFNENDEFVLRLQDRSRLRFIAVDYYPDDKTCGIIARSSIIRPKS